MLIVGWFLGVRGSLLFGILSFPLNTLLFDLVGDTAMASNVVAGLVGSSAFTLLGMTLGWIRGLLLRVREQSKELQKERNTLQQLMDNIPDYIYFKDRKSRFTLNNRAHAHALGAGSPSEMLGKTDSDYFGPEHATRAFDDEQRIISTGQPLVNILEKETWPNSPPTWVSSTKMPFRDERGEIIGTFGISRDMTERLQMEQKNLRLVAMIESSKDAIVGVGLDDEVTSWNKGAEKIFGYTAEEMIGKPITPLLSPDVQAYPSLNEKPMREARVQQFESSIQRKDGITVYVSTTFSPIVDANGLLVGVTSISRDVTDQRALQVGIIRAQRLESLGTLAAGVAHQFNNINMAIMGYLDIVAHDTTLSTPTQSCIKGALEAVHRAAEITDRLQGLTNAASTEAENLRLEQVVPMLFPLFEKKLKEDDISIQIDFQETSPVRTTGPTLSFIVTSLLTNSIHSLLDCPQRLINLRTRSAPGFSSFEVSDTGCGILPENLSKIFTPFFTTKGEWAEPKSAQSRVKGVGLSLAVCQSTVAESGGWIEVKSVPQQGSTFRVWFPAATSSPTDAGPRRVISP
jgi:PAS domain S-box-containing protein